MGLLISDSWKISSTASLNDLTSFEYHAIMVTAQVTIHVIVIYHPLGQLVNFRDALNILLSIFLGDRGLFIICGDMNIHLNKCQAADVSVLLI